MAYFVSKNFFETLLVVIIAVALIMGNHALDKKIVRTKGQNQKTLKVVKIFVEVINIVLLAMLFIVALSVNGVNVSVALRSLGVAGIIVGFALNDLLKDIIMGLSIMIEGYYKVGDSVIYNGRLGKVVSFNVKTTKIFMYSTEETLAVCNRNISEISKASDWVDVDVPISYSIDAKYARALCRICASRIERLRYVYSCDFLNTQSLEESWITYKLRIHHLVEKQPSVRRNALSIIQDVFAEHNVPFPLSIKVFYGEDNYKDSEKGRLQLDAVQANSSIKGYELGRGAEKSKVVSFDSSDETVESVMKEVERYTRAENLDRKMILRIRLLTEELLSVTRGLDNMRDGLFHIERSDIDYELVFEGLADVSKDRKKIMRKTMSEVGSAGFSSIIMNAVNSMLKSSRGDDESEVVDEARWSYNVYKEEQESIDNLMEKDVLERSVITSFADDLKISVIKNKVKMRLLVKNIEEEE